MWFKQITCDSCYKVITVIDRHNKYYVSDIIEFKKNSINTLSSDFNIKVNARTCLYCYKTQPLNSEKWLTFCSKECAIKYSKEKNCVLYYFDEEYCSVAFVLPHQNEINASLRKPHNTPNLDSSIAEWDWYSQFYDVADLSEYGNNCHFPTLSIGNYQLVEPSVASIQEMGRVISQADFMRLYYGYYDPTLAMKHRDSFVNKAQDQLFEFKSKFGRRQQIDWHIVDKTGKFIGFVHLTKLYPAFMGEWVLEFGLKSEYEGKGIMTNSVTTILNWARQHGCKDVYAISEIYNKGSHSLFRRIPFNVEESTAKMNDQYAGFRDMYNYHIVL